MHHPPPPAIGQAGAAPGRWNLREVRRYIDIHVDINTLSGAMRPILTPRPLGAAARSAATPLVRRAASGRRGDIVQIVQGLRRIVKALEVYSQEVRQRYGLNGPQLWGLKTLEREKRMTTGRMAAALAVHQSSISILLDRLEKRGLVRRSRGRADRRFVEVELTPRGRALAADAPEPAQGRLLHALGAKPAAQVRDLRRAVDQLVNAMEATDVKARFFFSDE